MWDDVFGIYQGSSEGGQRLVSHFQAVALEVCGEYLGDSVDVGKGCPSQFFVLVGPLFIRRELRSPSVLGMLFCLASKTL